jgi:AcrR family transcriptional regulator
LIEREPSADSTVLGIRPHSVAAGYRFVSPSCFAIYRYFSDRSALEAALADESARQLELALRKAADGYDPATAIRRMATAYLKFARDNRHLYEVMMSLHAPEHDATCRQSLWMFTIEQVQRIAGEDRAAQASVALWALLHGVRCWKQLRSSARTNQLAASTSDLTLGYWTSQFR